MVAKYTTYNYPMATLHCQVSMTSGFRIFEDLRLEVAFMEYDIKRSGAYIRTLRVKNQYTQEELAKTLKMDRSFLSRIESGEKGCSVDLLIRFSELFHVTLEALILGGQIEEYEFPNMMQQLDEEIAALIRHLMRFQAQLQEDKGKCV